jgi:DNA polymerase-3 subunit gamma/tau
MMATTQPEDIPQTIRSRCQHFSFHAVKFDEIVAQLAEIARNESIETDDEALAVLAEAGDGSMRDALSIMDQAIACCGTKLSGELVRGLAGTVGSDVFENLMATVARNSSEDALHVLDRLMTEGQNPAHFAKQFVRFLRNTVVAKVAGDDSQLLQISADERARVGRVAAQFSEEELARFLNIMLRTFDELGYRQEQRFHLELGVLKLVHAQRMLPLEQLLSQVSAEPGKPGAGPRQPATVAAVPSAPPIPRQQGSAPSPFEVDRARKTRSFEPEMSAGPAVTMQFGNGAVAAATAVAEMEVEAPLQESSPSFIDPAVIVGKVMTELENGGHKMLASTLETAAVNLRGGELVLEVPQSAAVIDMMMGAEPKRIANAAASNAAGRPVKVTVIGGAPAQRNGNGVQAVRPVRNGVGARARAAEDPVVRRMQEKFGAEIRTVIDHREKA